MIFFILITLFLKCIDIVRRNTMLITLKGLANWFAEYVDEETNTPEDFRIKWGGDRRTF